VAERARGQPAGFLTPKRVFLAVALLLFVAVLFAPEPQSLTEAALSSYGTDPGGARGLHDVLDRLGFTVERRLRPMRDSLERDRLYVVLDPPIPLTAAEVHLLLDAVRNGASLLVVPSLGSRVADSLHVVPAPEVLRRGARPDTTTVMRGYARTVLRSPSRSDSSTVFRLPAGGVIFLSVDTRRGTQPVVVGVALGRGRVVIAADRELLRNSSIRAGEEAVRAVRMIEWLQRGGRAQPIVFDEYHQGFGMQANVFRTTRRALLETPAGRAVVQAVAAGLFLLLAVGVRPLRPRTQASIERRSALEHVSALARAYSAVHARDRAAQLLVRGLRRRHGGLQSGRDDIAYLQAIRAQEPAVARDVDQLVATMTGAPAGNSAEVTSALARVERVLIS
jgi:hypothetical protein